MTAVQKKEVFMKIDPVNLPTIKSENTEGGLLKKEKVSFWNSSSLSKAEDPYDLDIKTVSIGPSPKELTGSVTCSPCNETNNSCYSSQCCSADCSRDPNCGPPATGTYC